MVVQGELGEDVIVPWRARRVLCHGGFETGSFVVLSRSRTCSRSNGFDQSLIRTCLIISPDAFDVTSYPRFLFVFGKEEGNCGQILAKSEDSH